MVLPGVCSGRFCDSVLKSQGPTFVANNSETAVSPLELFLVNQQAGITFKAGVDLANGLVRKVAVSPNNF